MKYLMKNIISNLNCFSVACFLTVCIFGSQVKASNNCPALLDSILSHDRHNRSVIATLLEYGADPNASLENCQFPFFTTTNGDYYFSKESTLLHIAAFAQHPSIYDMLLDSGADEEAIDHRGLTPEQLKQERSDNQVRFRAISRI